MAANCNTCGYHLETINRDGDMICYRCAAEGRLTKESNAVALAAVVRQAIADGYADGTTEDNYGRAIHACCNAIDDEPHRADCWVQEARRLLDMPEKVQA